MGFRLAVSGGAENISLDERTIEKVSFGSDSATEVQRSTLYQQGRW